MGNIFIFDPTEKDALSRFRGGGRMMQILKENLGDEAIFINDLSKVTAKDTLLIPGFKPFEKAFFTKRLAKKQILLIYDVIPLKYPTHFPIGLRGQINLWRNKQALKYYDRFITISHHSKKDLVHYLKIPEEKIEAIYPTITNVFINPKSPAKRDPAPRDKILNLKEFGNYCLYVGDVNWNKNLVNLARAGKLADVNCVFVGKNFSPPHQDDKVFAESQLFDPAFGGRVDLSHPWQKEFKDLLAEIGNDKRFIFLGYKDDQSLIKLYQQSKCNILISKDEGFGFSYLEAATLGCPSALTDTEVFHEVSGNQGALFANADDPSDIADKIRRFFDDPALRQKLSLEAQERAKYFSRAKFRQQWRQILAELTPIKKS